jgi:hypothetical protein
MMQQLLSYDSLGYFRPHTRRNTPIVSDYLLFSAKKAAQRAEELCPGREAETVYHVLGGTEPLFPYGIAPTGGPTLQPRS